MTARPSPGVVAMAVYSPDEALFTTQLRSIQEQSLDDFQCLLSVDGEPGPVAEVVSRATSGDDRFIVFGDGSRRGFHVNFERALQAVPTDAPWVALADQDDRWYPEKLSRLVPLLRGHVLVTCQARVVRHPGGQVLAPHTTRRWAPFDDLLVQNQVTGSQTVFRRELLDVALPFPRVHTVTQLHDHWLAVCAATCGSWAVLDEVLQDYVQHGANVVGEVGRRRWGPASAWLRMLALADDYEGGHSIPKVSRACNRLAFGWRREMLKTLDTRLGTAAGMDDALNALGADHRLLPLVQFLWARGRSGYVGADTLATFMPGLPAELFRRTRQQT